MIEIEFFLVKIVIHMKRPKSNSRYNNLSKLHQLNLIKLHLVFNIESHVSGDALYTQHATWALANAFGIDLNRFWFCVILSNGTPESQRDSVKSIYVGVRFTASVRRTQCRRTPITYAVTRSERVQWSIVSSTCVRVLVCLCVVVVVVVLARDVHDLFGNLNKTEW